MIWKVATAIAIAVLLGLRLARTPLGARFLGVPQRVLEIVFLVVLVAAGVLAVLFEQWILLIVVGILLLVTATEWLRARTAQPPREVIRRR